MSLKRSVSIALATAGLSFALSACGQSGGGGHMMSGGMGGGMMNGGMMMQTPGVSNPKDLPDPDSDGAKLLAQYCGQCHAPPSPTAHKAAEWPKVVERMNGYMTSQNKHVPNNNTTQHILQYLQQHAG